MFLEQQVPSKVSTHRSILFKPLEEMPDNRNDMSTDTTEWVTIGEIVAPFGLKGELKVLLQTDFPQRFKKKLQVYLGFKHSPYIIESVRKYKNGLLVKFEAIDDATSAERFRNTLIQIPESEIMPLRKNQFYVHDMIGLQVKHVNGADLGLVTDIIGSAGNDILVIKEAQTGNEVMLPAIKEMVKKVDIAHKVLLVDPVPGIFDSSFEEIR